MGAAHRKLTDFTEAFGMAAKSFLMTVAATYWSKAGATSSNALR